MSDKLASAIRNIAKDIPAGSFQSEAEISRGGWWLGVNLSNANKIGRIREACHVMELKLERDLKVDIPAKKGTGT